MKNKFRNLSRKGTGLSYSIFMYIGLNQNGELTYQRQIANYFHKVDSTISHHITKFRAQGLISKQKNPITLTTSGKKLFKYLWNSTNRKNLRCHNVQVVFNVLKSADGFPHDLTTIYEPLTNKKYKGIKAILHGFTCMCYSEKKIVAVLKNIFADTDEEISSVIQMQVSEVKSLLESEFNIKLRTYKIAKIQRMHIAVLNSEIAKAYLLKGFTEENKEFAIDNSHGIPETELTNNNTALRNIMSLLNIENIVKL